MIDYFSSTGINTYVNPLSQDGQLIHSLNMVSMPYGAKSKRPGYATFLGTPDTNRVQSLFSFSGIGADDTKMNLYRASGSSLYYSQQGTGAWTLCGNGTIAYGAHFGAAIGNGGTVLIGGDGTTNTRHTTNGTSFVDTTLAPKSEFFIDYQNRIYASGTASNNIFSTTNDATNWNTSGTSDSSSFRVPGEGKLQTQFKVNDRLVMTKSGGHMFQWDGYSQVDMATTYGPSPYSVAQSEGNIFYLNPYGHYLMTGNDPQLLSNAVQRYFYNRRNSGIAGTAFAQIPAECHMYDYVASIGSITDDFTGRSVDNAILNYNYQKNEYLLWQFSHFPTSYLTYQDTSGVQQLLFGDQNGQCYQMDRSLSSDAGRPIPTELVFLFTYDEATYYKKWNWIRLFFNPGCEARIQVAFANTFTYEHLEWVDIVDNSDNPNQNAADGVCEFRFQASEKNRSRLLFLRIFEVSDTSQWTYYGCSLDADVEQIR